MSFVRPVRRFGRLSLVVAGALTLAAAQPVDAPEAGVSCTLVMTRQIQSGAVSTTAFHGTFIGAAGRLDTDPGSESGGGPPGTYFLVSDTAGAPIAVFPDTRSYAPTQGGARLGGIVEPYTPMGTISNLTVTLDTLGPGEVLNGYATQHYRITSRFSLTLTANGVTATCEGVSDLWQAPTVPRIPNPFLGLGGDQAGADPSLRELNARLVVLQRGLPGTTLKSETSGKLLAGTMTVSSAHVDTQISDIHDAMIDRATLTIPDGYVLKKASAPKIGSAPMATISNPRDVQSRRTRPSTLHPNV